MDSTGLAIGNDFYKKLDQRELVNEATAIWSSPYYSLEVLNSGVIQNPAESVFDFQSEGSISFDSTGGTSGTFHNAGTLRKSAGSGVSRIDVAMHNTGAVDVQSGTLSLSDTLSIDGSNLLLTQPQAEITIHGGLIGNTTNADLFAPQGTIRLDKPGDPVTPEELEVMGEDLGPVSSGFMDNFAYGRLILENDAYVRLVDNADNSADSGDEALYVNELVVESGSTLDLNGLAVYARAAQGDGTVVGGLFQLLPDGGPIPMNTQRSFEVSAW